MRRKNTLVKDPEFFARSLGHLDDLNLRLAKKLAETGPRNLSRISRELGIPKRTLHARFVSLRKSGLLKVSVLPNFPKLGLSNHFVKIISTPGNLGALKRVVTSHPFLYRAFQSVSSPGIEAHFTVPPESIERLDTWLESLSEAGLAQSYQRRLLLGFKAYFGSITEYNAQTKLWNFDPDLALAKAGKTGRREVFPSSEAYGIYADKLDLVIIQKLQEDAATRLASISRWEKVSRSLVKYHYDSHVAGRLITGYVVQIPRFVPYTYGYFILRIMLRSRQDLETVARILAETPYARFMAKEGSSETLHVELEAPYTDFSSKIMPMVDALSRKYGASLVQISVLNPDPLDVKTIPLSLFREYGWEYREPEVLVKAEA